MGLSMYIHMFSPWPMSLRGNSEYHAIIDLPIFTYSSHPIEIRLSPFNFVRYQSISQSKQLHRMCMSATLPIYWSLLIYIILVRHNGAVFGVKVVNFLD